ncbi:hypothetical protein AN958_09789 [Leucoagaricus sp. SymC.cos]|nr:hypothetical protein AN958_09789 [Leucoagaricus sp. SymC.cos]
MLIYQLNYNLSSKASITTPAVKEPPIDPLLSTTLPLPKPEIKTNVVKAFSGKKKKIKLSAHAQAATEDVQYAPIFAVPPIAAPMKRTSSELTLKSQRSTNPTDIDPVTFIEQQ